MSLLTFDAALGQSFDPLDEISGSGSLLRNEIQMFMVVPVKDVRGGYASGWQMGINPAGNRIVDVYWSDVNGTGNWVITATEAPTSYRIYMYDGNGATINPFTGWKDPSTTRIRMQTHDVSTFDGASPPSLVQSTFDTYGCTPAFKIRWSSWTDGTDVFSDFTSVRTPIVQGPYSVEVTRDILPQDYQRLAVSSLLADGPFQVVPQMMPGSGPSNVKIKLDDGTWLSLPGPISIIGG